LRGRADGVVVGSRLVDAIRSGEDLAELVRNLKEATRG
jgi:tryptophan synthase alpha subunit